MKMRELERRTGVNRETIRVYLREGLLKAPLRPKANVAEYDESHVQGILAIRELQRTRGLKRFSNNSGIVITPAFRSGSITKPVRPTTQIAAAITTPIIASANPFS